MGSPAPDSGPRAGVTAAECHAVWLCATHVHIEGGGLVTDTHTETASCFHPSTSVPGHTATPCTSPAGGRPAAPPPGNRGAPQAGWGGGSWLAFQVWVQGHSCRPVGSPCAWLSLSAVSVRLGSTLQKRPGGHLGGRTADTPLPSPDSWEGVPQKSFWLGGWGSETAPAWSEVGGRRAHTSGPI